MSKIENYIVTATWFDDAAVTLQVDHEILTPQLATEINQFWGGAQERLLDEGGDVVLAVIRLFGATAIRFLMADGGANFGKGLENPRWTEQVLVDQGEGWPTLPELGILIAVAEVPAVDYDDVTVVKK